MDGTQLQKLANDCAKELPGVTVEHRVKPIWETFKVGGRVFMLMTDMPGHPVVTVKADPVEALLLREQYQEITAGYHMNKQHWVTASGGPGVDVRLVKQLVTTSYELVVEKLPTSARSVQRHDTGAES